MQDHYSITEFSLGTHVRILPLHNEHAGVQQCTVVNGEKALSLSLLGYGETHKHRRRNQCGWGAIAPPLFIRKKETHLLALQTAKQTGLNVTGNIIIPW